MKLTILGTSAAYPGAGEACSGFLVEKGVIKLLVDCGTGILSYLQKYLELTDVSDVVITHMHADHFFDLVPYRYALRYGLNKPLINKPHLYLPPGGSEVLSQVVAPFAEVNSFFSDVFDISEYDPERPLPLENLEMHFIPVNHYIPTYGITITDTRKLAYSSDSGLCSGLLNIAQNADMFICNTGACLDNTGQSTNWGHLAPEQAGALAKEAGVRRLLLSHLWPNCKRNLSIDKASAAFGGFVELAKSCHTYRL